MKAYLTNGRVIRISSRVAEEIVKVKTAKETKKAVLQRTYWSQSIDLYIEIDQVIAIK